MTGHRDTSRHGWTCEPSVVVPASRPRVFTRAEIAGFAEHEQKINRLLGHGDQPSDWYFARLLAEIDGTLAIQGAA